MTTRAQAARAAQIKNTRSLDVAYVQAQDTLQLVRQVLEESGDKLPVYTIVKLRQILAEKEEGDTE